MPLYTFYPSRSDGVAITMALLEERDDREAVIAAVQILEEHQTARDIAVWQDSRRVITLVRVDE